MRDLLEKRKPSNTISSYVLGFYLPWLFVGRSIPDLEIIEHPEVKWDIDTTELNVLEAADELKIGIDKEYVYNIRSKPLVEKYSMEKKLLDHGLPEEVVSAFRFGCSLSESYVMFDDEKSRHDSLNEAESHALGIKAFNKEAINKFLTELRKKYEKQDFGEKLNEFSTYLINSPQT